jgi:hypothetical protein
MTISKQKRKKNQEMSAYTRINEHVLDIDYLETADTGMYECFYPDLPTLSQSFYLAVKYNDTGHPAAAITASTLTTTTQVVVVNANVVLPDKNKQFQRVGDVVFNGRGTAGRRKQPEISHRKGSVTTATPQTNEDTNVVEMIKDEGEDAELPCPLTKNYEDIKWLKRDEDVINKI